MPTPACSKSTMEVLMWHALTQKNAKMKARALEDQKSQATIGNLACHKC